MQILLEALLWFSIGMVIFVTGGYPATLALISPLIRRRRQVADAEPTVSLIIAAHNEERCLAQKLENSLALDYPKDRLEIIVASDGSTDRTCEIAQAFANRGVVLRSYERIGKTGMQNLTVRSARGDIIVFSDANAFYRPDAIRKLVRNFADPTVACVSGQLIYRSQGKSAGDCEDSYWNYEKFMKRRESDLSSLIGANGSIYAVRRADYVEIANDLISDFVEPLALVRSGRRVVYEPEAISIEEASTTYSVEFRRKVRILTRSINGLLHMRALLNPFEHGIFALQLIAHKLCRYLVPLFLGVSLLALSALALVGERRLLFAMVMGGMVVSTLVARRVQPGRGSVFVRTCHFIYYYLLVNFALVLAWKNVLSGTGMTVWVPDREGASAT